MHTYIHTTYVLTCSNNQAEQLAILKVLETIESMNSHSINPRSVTIFTDSRVSLDSLTIPIIMHILQKRSGKG